MNPPHWTEVATFWILAVTLACLIVYTWKTWQLATAARCQNRTILRPILILEFPENRVPGGDNLTAPTIRNIGFGPAFNIEIDSIENGEYRAEFEPILFLKQGSEVPVIPTTLKGGQFHNMFSRTMQYFVDLLRENTGSLEDTLEIPVRIVFVDANGENHSVRQKLNCARPAMVLGTTYEGGD